MEHEHKKIEPVFLIGIMLFVFAIGVYAYNGYLDRKALESNVVSNLEIASTTEEVASTSADVKPVATNNKNKSVSNATQFVASATTSTTLICNASTLDGSVSWQAVGGTLAGTAKINNRGSEPCVLLGFPQITVVSGIAVLGTSQVNSGSRASVIINPSTSAYLHFNWSNWCNSGNLSGVQMQAKIVLEGNNGYLQLPFISTNGSPQSDTPRCNSSTSQSVISVNSYSTY